MASIPSCLLPPPPPPVPGGEGNGVRDNGTSWGYTQKPPLPVYDRHVVSKKMYLLFFVLLSLFSFFLFIWLSCSCVRRDEEMSTVFVKPLVEIYSSCSSRSAGDMRYPHLIPSSLIACRSSISKSVPDSIYSFAILLHIHYYILFSCGVSIFAWRPYSAVHFLESV